MGRARLLVSCCPSRAGRIRGCDRREEIRGGFLLCHTFHRVTGVFMTEARSGIAAERDVYLRDELSERIAGYVGRIPAAVELLDAVRDAARIDDRAIAERDRARGIARSGPLEA